MSIVVRPGRPVRRLLSDHRARTCEAGETSPEYVAVMLVVSTLVAAVVLLGLPTTIGDWGEYAICALFDDDSGCTRPGELPPLADEDYAPDRCDLATTEYSGSIEGSALVFDASKGILFARTDRSDGTTEFTVVDDGSLGVSAEIGLEAELGAADLDVGAEAGVSAIGELGSTWVVATDEADDFRNQLLEETGEDAVADGVPLVGGVMNWLADKVNGDLRDPDITFVAGGVQADADASAEVNVLGETVAGASVGVEGAVRIGTEKDRSANKSEQEWTDTDYFQVDLSVSGEIGLLTAQATGEMSTSQIMKVTRNMDREIVEVELISSVSNASMVGVGDLTTDNLLRGAEESSVVQTITLRADDDTQREILEGWLADGSHPEFDDYVHNRGQMSVMEYSGDEFGLSLGGEVALGVKLGLSASLDQLDNELTDAIYYGAPRPNGERVPVSFADCLDAR